jgi:hypothetical protein
MPGGLGVEAFAGQAERLGLPIARDAAAPWRVFAAWQGRAGWAVDRELAQVGRGARARPGRTRSMFAVRFVR